MKYLNFCNPKLDVEAHKSKIAGRLFRKTLYQGEIIFLGYIWIINMHDKGKNNFIGSKKVIGFTLVVR